MEYNTTREKLTLREYGRNFHKLINHVKEVKAKAKRTSLSKTLVKLMNMAHPEFRNQNEVEQKLWDDLYIMSDFDLDVDSPYPKPKKEELAIVGDRLKYPKNKTFLTILKNYYSFKVNCFEVSRPMLDRRLNWDIKKFLSELAKFILEFNKIVRD